MDEKLVKIEDILNSAGGSTPVPPHVVVEIMEVVKDNQTNLQSQAHQSSDFIKIKMHEETDWKKKASFAAMLISRSLEY